MYFPSVLLLVLLKDLASFLYTPCSIDLIVLPLFYTRRQAENLSRGVSQSPLFFILSSFLWSSPPHLSFDKDPSQLFCHRSHYHHHHYFIIHLSWPPFIHHHSSFTIFIIMHFHPSIHPSIYPIIPFINYHIEVFQYQTPVPNWAWYPRLENRSHHRHNPESSECVQFLPTPYPWRSHPTLESLDPIPLER